MAGNICQVPGPTPNPPHSREKASAHTGLVGSSSTRRRRLGTGG